MSLYNSGVRAKIDEYLLEEAKKERDYGEYWSASSAGYCMRKLIFERLGVPKIEQDGDARKQRVFTSGHIFHEWIQKITRDAGVSIAQEAELQDEELMVRGHFDDLILIELDLNVDGVVNPDDGKMYSFENPKHLILYDYKTVNSRSFMWAKKNGNTMSHFHRMQLGTYMYMLNSKELVFKNPKEKYEFPKNSIQEARILKIEKDTLMMGEQQLMWTPDLKNDVVSFWRTLNDYWKRQTMPKCTCADYEGGFMAKEAYNGYFYNDEPCSLEYYKQWKEKKS